MLSRSSASIRIAAFVCIALSLVNFIALPFVSANNPVSGTIIGMVRDKKTQKPIYRAIVRAVNDLNGHVRTTISDAQGEYRLPFLPGGTYTIKASGEGYLPETLPKFLVQFGQYNPVLPKYFRLDIELRKTSLNGVVVDGANQVLADSRVEIINQKTKMVHEAVTGENGAYEISDLSPGRYLIKASWTSGESGPSVNDEPVSLPIILDREEVIAPTIKIPSAVASPKSRVTSNATSDAQAGTPSTTSSAVGSKQATEGEKVSAMIRAVDAARGGNFDERQLGALPLGAATYSRSFDELALLLPGVAPPPYTPGARGPGVGFGVGTAGQFSVNGLRARSNNFSVDGADNNDADVGVRRQGFVALTPQSIESVQGVSIATLLWDAELGRNSGAQVNAVSKYGANDLHGQVYGFGADSSLNARNFFDYTGGSSGGKSPFTRTQTGGVIGGPIVKGHAHFFASYEHDQINASTEQHFATPTAAERVFRDRFVCPTGTSCQPNGAAFGAFAFDNLQNFNGVTPLGKNILALYPLPNFTGGPFGANTYAQVLPAGGAGDIASFRVTQQFGEGRLLNARYNFTDDDRALPSVNRAINSTMDSQTRSHNLSLIFDSAVGQTKFNQARFSFGRTRLNFRQPAGSPSSVRSCLDGITRRSAFIFQQCSDESITIGPNSFSFTSQTGPIGELLIEPFSPVGVGVFYFPQDRASNTFQFADAFSWTLGKHQLKFGGAVRRYQLNSRLDRLYRPQVVYAGGLIRDGDVTRNLSGNLLFNPKLAPSPSPQPQTLSKPAVITGVEMASLGPASAVLQTITSGAPDSTIGLRFNEYHVFINDNWRARPNFTLDYGLRYEYSSVPRSVDKRLEESLVLNNIPVEGVSRFNTPSRTSKFVGAVDAYRQILGGRNRIYDQDWNNFGPHVGFAWDPFASSAQQAGKTVARGGYGIYYDTILGAVVTQSRNVFPNEIPINVDPSFLQFDAYSLNNPALLKIVRDAQGNFTNPVSLLNPTACNQFGSCNQFGGAPGDFVALIGQLFQQNQLGGGLAFTLTEKNLRTPYAQHWHLTIERLLFDDLLVSAAYVGTKGTKLTRLVTPNLGSLVTPYIPLARSFREDSSGITTAFPFPVIFNSLTNQPLVGGALQPRSNNGLGAYQIYENSASSTYHALQIEARKRYNHGFQFTAAYTWSHAIDDVSDIFTMAGAPIFPQDGRNLRLERGNANFDLRHRFAASVIWDLPSCDGNRGLGKLVFGDWQVASVFQAQTGQPFTLTVPFDNNFDGNLSDRPATTTGLIFAEGGGRNRVSLPGAASFTDYLNYTVNGLSLIPGVGYVGRNTVRGDSFINLDLSLTKNFRLAEQRNLLFRAEFFNALNRADFGLPIRTIGAPGFGSAVETVNPARTIQFALKYSF